MNTRKLLSLITPAVALALLPLGAAPGVASAQTSGCTQGPNVRVIQRSVTGGQWTGYYGDEATPNCRDFNVMVTGLRSGCEVTVDAEYNRNGVWTDGAAGWITFGPNDWQEPITRLADGTSLRARFRFECTDSAVQIHLAA